MTMLTPAGEHELPRRTRLVVLLMTARSPCLLTHRFRQRRDIGELVTGMLVGQRS
jgi:Kef-type K+ transport system membrane component KefB